MVAFTIASMARIVVASNVFVEAADAGVAIVGDPAMSAIDSTNATATAALQRALLPLRLAEDIRPG